jgi:hypothetical protein
MAWLYELGCRESSLPRSGRLDPAGFHPHACALRLPEAQSDRQWAHTYTGAGDVVALPLAIRT